MNRRIGVAVISAVALFGGAIVGSAPAYAAVTPTLVLAERSAVVDMGPVFITATASTAGSVKFSEAGLVIKGCEAVATTTVSPFIAKCSWTPTKGGPTVLSGTLTPTDAVNFTVVDAQLIAKVGVPQQGTVSPISIYADTVLASGAQGPLAPRFGTGCNVTTQYLVGQRIVFRIFANNADEGGVAMDPRNTEKAFIEISGVKDPIPLRYGNHSGGAFWVAVLATGAAPLYNALGVINYKVTFTAKSTSSVKVLSTKRVLARDAAGALVLNEAGNLTFKWTSYYRDRKLPNPIQGATGSYTPTWAATGSLLTLYALPTA